MTNSLSGASRSLHVATIWPVPDAHSAVKEAMMGRAFHSGWMISSFRDAFELGSRLVMDVDGDTGADAIPTTEDLTRYEKSEKLRRVFRTSRKTPRSRARDGKPAIEVVSWLSTLEVALESTLTVRSNRTMLAADAREFTTSSHGS